ncbi:hypothetical protein [Sphingosinithalassobacter portus]|uniref:hypothetical protein n=1 Tax=Stakelama portus TaxID=2676234 RepID=UPI0011AB4B5C|nr:hypothetical protein [Sphingosinithalassobacter portus]
MRNTLSAMGAALAMLAGPAAAQSVEQLDQLEPGAGEVQVEYFGAWGGEGEQAFELLAGVTDHLAVGGEAEFEGPRDGLMLEQWGVAALWRFADPQEARVATGLMAELGLDRSGALSDITGRFIAESIGERWWWQANLIVRHAREAGERGTGLAYGASVQRALAEQWWLGVEASGQFARLSGAPELAPRGAHWFGPSLTADIELTESSELEIGAAWMFRVVGDGQPSGPRIFLQATF